MHKRYRVTLTAEERAELDCLISRGKAAARTLGHARMLLLSDTADGGPGWTDVQVAEAVRVHVRSVERVRRRFVEEGLEAALHPKPSRRVYERKLDGADEARLVALACSTPPQGRRRWSLRLLADELVALEGLPRLSPETIRRTLGKKPAQATPSQDVVHPARAVGGVRQSHGGRARRLPAARRSAPAPGVPGRDQPAVDR